MRRAAAAASVLVSFAITGCSGSEGGAPAVPTTASATDGAVTIPPFTPTTADPAVIEAAVDVAERDPGAGPLLATADWELSESGPAFFDDETEAAGTVLLIDLGEPANGRGDWPSAACEDQQIVIQRHITDYDGLRHVAIVVDRAKGLVTAITPRPVDPDEPPATITTGDQLTSVPWRGAFCLDGFEDEE